MVRSVLLLSTGGGRTASGVEYSRVVSDVRFPPARLRLFDDPSSVGLDMWRVLGHGLADGTPVVGTIIQPER
eukprot:14061627-Alexandrium_andersonii.AAC.1